MEQRIFEDLSVKPDDQELSVAYGEKYALWKEIRDFAFERYPKATEEWFTSGKKYGWSFRIKDKKRAIIYFIPYDHFFKVAFVYGEKATREALNSSISAEIKTIIDTATVYAEGRGFRINVSDPTIIEDIKKLIAIKLSN
jgi:hypothetical protein